MMASDASKSPEQVLELPVETRTVPPPDDPVAERLRGFGPLGIIAILVILAGNGLFAPLSAILVLVWVWRSRTPLAHYSLQGLPGVEQATIFGLVFGTIMAVTGRIFVLMVAHAAFDLTALAMIYWGLEFRVAHLIF